MNLKSDQLPDERKPNQNFRKNILTPPLTSLTFSSPPQCNHHLKENKRLNFTTKLNSPFVFFALSIYFLTHLWQDWSCCKVASTGSTIWHLCNSCNGDCWSCDIIARSRPGDSGKSRSQRHWCSKNSSFNTNPTSIFWLVITENYDCISKWHHTVPYPLDFLNNFQY